MSGCLIPSASQLEHKHACTYIATHHHMSCDYKTVHVHLTPEFAFAVDASMQWKHCLT